MCYRHIVLIMPSLLCELCSRKTILLQALPGCGGECLKKFYNIIKRKKIEAGFIVVLHTYDRNGFYNVHLHIITTSGGLDNNNCWHEITYFPYNQLHLLRQKYLLAMLKDKLWE
jgi:hypothetical protein